MSYPSNPSETEDTLILESLKREQRLARTASEYNEETPQTRISSGSYLNARSLPEYSDFLLEMSQNPSAPGPCCPPETNENSPLNTGRAFIPPPTAFRDKPSGYFDSLSFDKKPFEVLELKRPPSRLLKGNDSDFAFKESYNFGPRNYMNSIVQNRRKFSESQEIFDVPKVYNPPPLVPRPETKVSLKTAHHLQQPGVMPSFIDARTPHRSHPAAKLLPSTVFSEPLFQTSLIKAKPFLNSLPSPRLNTKTFIVSSPPEACEQRRNSKSTPNFQIGRDNDVHSADSCPVDISGSGDHNDTLRTTPTLLKIHNCLSPRAKTPRKAELMIPDVVAKLKSPHWEDNFEGFSQIFNLTELNPFGVKQALSKIIWHGLPHLSSPRSKLARMACICFKRLFQTQKRDMEGDGERIFYRLLDLCGGMANSFIQQESREALVAAVENLDPLKSLSFLELHGVRHKNPHVREFAAYLLTAIVDEVPQSRLMNKEFSPRLIPMIVSFLREGLQQTRLHAKLALDKIFDHSTFDSKLRRYVTPDNVRQIAETLREFRDRRSGH